MSISIKEFFALAGSRFSQDDAKLAGPVLQELAVEGHTSSDAVVQAAHSENSPLRKFFEWDNVKASHLYRVSQADELIGSVRVRYVAENRPATARAFTIIAAPAVKPLPKQTYVEFSRPYRVQREPNLEAVIVPPVAFQEADAVFIENIETALKELEQWRTRWKPFADRFARFESIFIPVLNQIGEFEDAFAGQFGINADVANILVPLRAWQDHYVTALSLAPEVKKQVEFLVSAIDDAFEAHDVLMSGTSEALKKSHQVRDWQPRSKMPEEN